VAEGPIVLPPAQQGACRWPACADRTAKQIEGARKVTTFSAKLLRQPKPDSFAGRKTHDPFPKEDTHMAKWIASKELQPPK